MYAPEVSRDQIASSLFGFFPVAVPFGATGALPERLPNRVTEQPLISPDSELCGISPSLSDKIANNRSIIYDHSGTFQFTSIFGEQGPNSGYILLFRMCVLIPVLV